MKAYLLLFVSLVGGIPAFAEDYSLSISSESDLVMHEKSVMYQKVEMTYDLSIDAMEDGFRVIIKSGEIKEDPKSTEDGVAQKFSQLNYQNIELHLQENDGSLNFKVFNKQELVNFSEKSSQEDAVAWNFAVGLAKYLSVFMQPKKVGLGTPIVNISEKPLPSQQSFSSSELWREFYCMRIQEQSFKVVSSETKKVEGTVVSWHALGTLGKGDVFPVEFQGEHRVAMELEDKNGRCWNYQFVEFRRK